MPVSEKTRKILWGRSGNRCAQCRHELVIDGAPADDESVVGNECHIVSGKSQGPRHDPAFPPERLDEPENLILLCPVHHKMIDDQCETYTREVLQRLKANHEKWVSSTLAEDKQLPRVRIRRIKENIPSHLARLTSGQDVLKVIGNSSAFSFDHDEPGSEAEVALLSGFVQEVQEWGDLLTDLEAGNRVRTAYRLSTLVRELEMVGFWVFGGQEVQRLEGGTGAPTSFPVAILRVLRATNPEIIRVDFRAGAAETQGSQAPKNTPLESERGNV
jgi:hypothetical protein